MEHMTILVKSSFMYAHYCMEFYIFIHILNIFILFWPSIFLMGLFIIMELASSFSSFSLIFYLQLLLAMIKLTFILILPLNFLKFTFCLLFILLKPFIISLILIICYFLLILFDSNHSFVFLLVI